EDELEDARWFSRDDLHERMRKDAADGKLSRSDSIARWLINDWLNEGS
ncbi:MAG: NAD(+) diphosphatase, partial [Rhodospirillales bacterium]|nr:NAD(+) diphosphatase [Rhodospirillales bacterium]